MNTLNGAINNMSADLRYELEVAWQQVVQQGNVYPLIEFYNRHELELQKEYNISLNDLMGIDPNKLNKKPKNVTHLEIKNSTENPLSSLIFSKPKKSTNKISLFSALALAAGLLLIVKSFKK